MIYHQDLQSVEVVVPRAALVVAPPPAVGNQRLVQAQQVRLRQLVRVHPLHSFQRAGQVLAPLLALIYIYICMQVRS